MLRILTRLWPEDSSTSVSIERKISHGSPMLAFVVVLFWERGLEGRSSSYDRPCWLIVFFSVQRRMSSARSFNSCWLIVTLTNITKEGAWATSGYY